MKKLLTLLVSLGLVLGAAMPGSADAELPAETDASMTPDAGWNTRAINLWGSDRNVQVASGRDGTGIRQSLRPDQWASRDTDSVWIGYTVAEDNCKFLINGYHYDRKQWLNTAWWRWINIDVRCG